MTKYIKKTFFITSSRDNNKIFEQIILLQRNFIVQFKLDCCEKNMMIDKMHKKLILKSRLYSKFKTYFFFFF